MTTLFKIAVAPLTNITGPLYHLARGDRRKEDCLQQLIFASFRTATAAALFFMIIPFNRIFGHKDNLAGSFVFAAQWMVYPYAAALFNAYMNGGHLLVMKGVDLIFKQRLTLTRNDVGGFARAFAFCYLANLLNRSNASVDILYLHWSHQLAHWLTGPNAKRSSLGPLDK
ncbi:MAG TPA: hypothetical protein VMR37_06405 [Rhabdochlamydiaceae bacterium]|nr:hypothetical protein [Rhabdochlamydiaceae bacterium]